jgi:phosphate transport system substrate-binding protein
MTPLPSPGPTSQAVGPTLAAALLLAVAGCTTVKTDNGSVEGMATPIRMVLSGAGSSFTGPLYRRWFDALAQQGVGVTYQSVGSGAGLQQFTYNLVDFAAIDVPLQPAEVARERRGVVQIPMTAGALVVAYQHKGCELKLSQAQLAGIFLGSITDYAALGCQAKPIRLVVRADGSSTTANFTAHLAAISPSWKEKVGTGKLVKWPVGTQAKGSEGVVSQLRAVDGALGVVQSSLVQPPLHAAALTNGSGQVVAPTLDNQRAALATIDLGPDLTGRNPNPRSGYPLVTYSWILLPKTGNGQTNLGTIRKVFGYGLSQPAQAIAEEMGYVGLPESVRTQSLTTLTAIQP